MYSDYVNFGLLCVTSFFTLINPMGIMPVFMTMTMDLNPAERNRVARKATLVGLLTILAFGISGQFLFKFFGISVDSMRIVGGIIFLFIGMDMLQARLTRTKLNDNEVKNYVNDISITPLAIPIICGPGAIVNSIILWNDADTLILKIIMAVAVIIVLAVVYIVLRSSSKLLKIMGETGINVMMRLMGLIMMVIAVEFFFSGLKPIVKTFFS